MGGAGTTTLRFLSTLSLRRATRRAAPCPRCSRDFYPRSPCGERQRQNKRCRKPHDFYPRSPCGERLDRWLAGLKGTLFLSTLSLRRATRRSVKLFRQNYISIHALLAESDGWLELFLYYQDNNFYPRSPCGERLLLS